MAELQKNMEIRTLIKFLEPKAEISIWESDTRIFTGKVYQLFDKLDMHEYFITFLRFDEMAGINCKVCKEWQ